MILFFYLFATFTIIDRVGVIYRKNSVYSLFHIIMSFLNVASIIIILGAEFTEISMIILQVGASIILLVNNKLINGVKNINYDE